MTAIAGFWSCDGRFDAAERSRAMISAQSAYGTRQSATAELDGLAFACRLFPLLPEDEYDRQPLVGGDGRLLLVADIRLDNRSELAGALGVDPARAARLADSGLLLLALERWGEDAVGRLLGDFAFAFHDPREGKLLLVRDPLGQRPLFWHRGSGFFAFSSMPSGLHALVPRRIDETNLVRFLGSLPRCGPNSFYEGIERVEPGHVVTLTRSGMTARRYWRPERRALGLKSFADYVDAYRSELDAAVARRLRGSEGHVAAHLSGGWDSNATAATAARLTAAGGGRVIAFTHVPSREAGAPPSNRFADEGGLAAATARLHANIDHVAIPGSGRSPLADLDSYADLFGRPVFNLCNHVWLSEIRTAAKAAGARILLSGEIGNWTISAAPNSLLADFLREGRLLAWSQAARGLVRSGRARWRGVAASSFGPWLPDPLWRRISGFASGPEAWSTDPVHPRLQAAIAEEQQAARSDRPRNSFDDAVDALLTMDWGEHRKGILGGWGLDKRDPTADVRLIEFCLSLPIDMLMKHGERRPLARAALVDRVAPEVLDERRKGYQSADWHVGLTRDRASVARLLDAMADNATASRLIDVERLRGLARNWPSGGWEDPRTIGAYRIGLLKGITAGHFILAAGP
jgi:asparagine synthase (glutamine-hydrolysing)